MTNDTLQHFVIEYRKRDSGGDWKRISGGTYFTTEQTIRRVTARYNNGNHTHEYRYVLAEQEKSA